MDPVSAALPKIFVATLTLIWSYSFFKFHSLIMKIFEMSVGKGNESLISWELNWCRCIICCNQNSTTKPPTKHISSTQFVLLRSLMEYRLNSPCWIYPVQKIIKPTQYWPNIIFRISNFTSYLVTCFFFFSVNRLQFFGLIPKGV